jgi:hypothetical protein
MSKLNVNDFRCEMDYNLHFHINVANNLSLGERFEYITKELKLILESCDCDLSKCYVLQILETSFLKKYFPENPCHMVDDCIHLSMLGEPINRPKTIQPDDRSDNGNFWRVFKLLEDLSLINYVKFLGPSIEQFIEILNNEKNNSTTKHDNLPVQTSPINV